MPKRIRDLTTGLARPTHKYLHDGSLVLNSHGVQPSTVTGAHDEQADSMIEALLSLEIPRQPVFSVCEYDYE
jgi:hypothetical protein